LEKRRRKSTQTNLKQINNTKNKQQQQINKSTKNNLKIAKNLKITNGCCCNPFLGPHKK
jgi:hypothetical protein